MSNKEAKEFARDKISFLDMIRDDLTEIRSVEEAHTRALEYANAMLAVSTAKLIHFGINNDWNKKFAEVTVAARERNIRERIEDAIFLDDLGDTTGLAQLLREEAQELEMTSELTSSMQATAQKLAIIANFIDPEK